MEKNEFEVRSESAQTMAEYAVTLTVIAIGVIVALGTFATAISSVMTRAVTLV
jgi:Flp pilus assembly pilin Flp